MGECLSGYLVPEHYKLSWGRSGVFEQKGGLDISHGVGKACWSDTYGVFRQVKSIFFQIQPFAKAWRGEVGKGRGINRLASLDLIK